MSEMKTQPGILSKLGRPSGIMWNACLSTVKIATLGTKRAGSSIVPTFTAISPPGISVPIAVPQFGQNRRVTALGTSLRVKEAGLPLV
ncbi:MAG: hypothetical protein WA049_05375 [Ferribacterium limneticum]